MMRTCSLQLWKKDIDKPQINNSQGHDNGKIGNGVEVNPCKDM